MTEKVGQKQAWKWGLAALVSLAFVAARVLGAYWMQYSVNGDYSIVVLMARRMAQGLEFPLFFYGQGYMGSLEPMFSALLCRLFGFSGFTICMGTVVFSVAMMPFLYLLGRSAGGWQAGIAAVLYCVIGPGGFFYYTASPRGGYAALLFFTVFLLWLSLELIRRELAGKRCGWLSYAGVGFAAGIAWWVDPLVSPAIIAGAIVYLLVMRGKTFTNRGPYAAAGGFLTGLIPFFLWNIQNEWQSFEFVARATHWIDFSKGLRLFFRSCVHLLDFGDLPWYSQIPFACVYAGTFVFAVFAAAQSLRRDRGSLRSISRGLILLFVVLSAVSFSYSDLSSVKTPRYLLPLVPAIGLILGLSVALLTGWRKYIAVSLLLMICLFQAVQLKVFWNMKNDSDLKLEQAAALSEYLVDNEIRNLYVRFQDQYLNYFLDERFLFCNSSSERYLPYAGNMERAPNAAIINGMKEVDDLLSSIRAGHKKATVAGYELRHNIERSMVLSAEVATGSIASVTDITGEDYSFKLFDRSLLSGWTALSKPDKAAELVVTFKDPVRISGLRMLCRPGLYPRTWSMSGRTTTGSEWKEMIGNTDVSPFFWSGRRLYSKGLFYRLEGQAPEMLCKQLKLSFPAARESAGLRISELQFFSGTTGNAAGTADIEKLAVWLENAGIVRVYADRWESNQLDGRCACEVVRDMSYTGAVRDDGIPIRLDRVTAMVVRREDAGWTRGVLAGYGVAMLETEIGPWTVFHFRDEQWNRDYTAVDGLLWVGFGAAVESHKHRGLTLAGMAERVYAREGATPDAIKQMNSALQVYGNYRPGVGRLAVWLEEAGRDRESAVWKENYEGMWNPSFVAEVDFAGRAVLQGVTPERINVTPGSKFRMKYFWKCGADYSVRNLGVFVHFKRDKKILFQDDRPLLEEIDVLFQPFDEVLVEDRMIVVPYDVEPGDCEVWMGITDGVAQNNRLSLRTDLPQQRKAVHLPLVLHIRDN